MIAEGTFNSITSIPAGGDLKLYQGTQFSDQKKKDQIGMINKSLQNKLSNHSTMQSLVMVFETHI